MALKPGEVRIVWRKKRTMQASVDKMWRGMQVAVIFLEQDAKRLVSRLQPVITLSSGRVIGLDPSKEGESPKIVTFTLRNNIKGVSAKRGNKVFGWIGVRKGPADKYAMRLERGFVGVDRAGRFYDQKPRPFLSCSLKENKKRVARIITSGGVSGRMAKGIATRNARIARRS